MKTNNQLRIAALILFALNFKLQTLNCFAQQEMTLPFMTRTFQSTITNPAFFPKNNFVIAFPGISMVYNAAHTGFTWHQLIHKAQDGSDSTEFYFEDVYKKRIRKKNYLFVDENTDYLIFGFRANKIKMHFLVNVTEKINTRFKYGKDFIGFIGLGNGYDDFEGKELNWNLALEGNHYREYGVTLGYTEENKYSLGLKLKYLQGIGNVSVEKPNILFTTKTEPYDEVVASTDYTANVSGFVVYETKDSLGNMVDSSAEFDASEYLFNFKNSGFGFDLGGTYTFKLPILRNKFTVSASLLDVGFIKWKSNVMNLHSEGTYTFRGLDLNKVINENSKFTIDNVYDTLNERFKFKKTYDSYKTSLIAKTYLTARMEIDTVSNVGLMLFGEFFEGLKPGVAVAYERAFGKKKRSSYMLTWSYKNRSWLNIGLGWQVRVGPLQLFACGDNLSAYFFYRHTKSFNLRFGMNFVFGKTKFPEPKKKENSVM